MADLPGFKIGSQKTAMEPRVTPAPHDRPVMSQETVPRLTYRAQIDIAGHDAQVRHAPAHRWRSDGGPRPAHTDSFAGLVIIAFSGLLCKLGPAVEDRLSGQGLRQSDVGKRDVKARFRWNGLPLHAEPDPLAGPRPQWPDRHGVIRLLALAFAIGGGALFLGLRQPDPAAVKGEVEAVARIETPILLVPGLNTAAILQTDKFAISGKFAGQAPDTDSPGASPGHVAFTMYPPYDIINGRSFQDRNGPVTLAGISGPSRGALCLDDAKATWACGLWARAVLNNATRMQELTCFGDRDAPAPAPVSCTTREGDLAAALVLSGFARPVDDRSYKDELANARRARRGMWIGGWTIKEERE